MVVKTSLGYWQVSITNASTDHAFFTGKRKVISLNDNLIIGEDEKEMRDRCHTIGRQLCSLFNRAPIPYPPGGGGTSLARMLIRLTIQIE